LKEHISIESLQQFLRRELPSPEFMRLIDHLSTCETCQTRAVEGFDFKEPLRALDTTLRAEALGDLENHLSYEQLESLVDDKIDSAASLEIYQSHLSSCRLCTSEFDDLRIHKMSLAEDVRLPSWTFAQTLDAFRKILIPSIPLRIATAVAILLVVMFGLFIWKRSQPTPQITQQLPEVTSQPEGTPSPNSSLNQKPSPDELILVRLNDAGGIVTINDRGEAEGLPTLLSSTVQTLQRSIKEQRIPVDPEVAGLHTVTESILGDSGDSESFSLLEPIGRVVRTSRPRFNWRPLAEATEYTVSVLDSKLQPIVTSPPLTQTTWTPPTPLARGVIYTWQVSAAKSGRTFISPAPPAPQARFKIVDAANNAELNRLETSRKRSHLALGVLYARVGLFVEAERELNILVRANPDSDLARKLLNNVRALRLRKG